MAKQHGIRLLVIHWPEIALIVAGGTLAGNELGVAAFVHPTLRKLSDTSHAEAAQMIARVLGRVMPFFYAAVLLLSLVVAWRSGWTGLSLFVAGVYTASIILTVVALVPINNKIAEMDPLRPPADWKLLRARWDRLHLVRVAMLVVAVVLTARSA